MSDSPNAAVPQAPGRTLPDQVKPLSWLLGTWVGVGLGHYPGIADFRFGQEIVFANDGRPFISHSSSSWILNEDGERIRSASREVGFWRPQPDGSVEVLLSHASGFVEMYLGETTVTAMDAGVITAARVELATDVVVRAPSAKEYTAGHRMYGLVDGDLAWAYDMAAMGHHMQNHLSAKLAKLA